MKKTVVMWLGVLVIIIAAVVFLNSGKEESAVQLLQDESYFSEFFIKNGKVYIKCYLTLKNTSSEDRIFQLNAIMKDEVKLGLLKEEKLDGYNQELTSKQFVIGKDETKSYTVVFVGNFAGKNKKQNRNLPKIEIAIIQ